LRTVEQTTAFAFAVCPGQRIVALISFESKPWTEQR